MPNVVDLHTRDGFIPCLVRKCNACMGTGQIGIVPYSANGQNTGLHTGLPVVTPCTCCINGFQFKEAPIEAFIDWIWQGLFSYVETNPQISAEFLQLIVRATENKMTNPSVNWALAAGCVCSHAPEQHAAVGCSVVRVDGSNCPCRARRLPR